MLFGFFFNHVSDNKHVLITELLMLLFYYNSFYVFSIFIFMITTIYCCISVCSLDLIQGFIDFVLYLFIYN